ncbi:MAG: hypothetical protein K0U86_03710 [Planctomycetes bacterium]|nr:hypothetical protein [Planctomycetota bacterium]MCH9723991.1 hypothetical protein [Planctomycetota bacterium]MCH9774876.1 hypothetical protein [Planctomycetota bacterium]MCH9793320.1 hypothetical protein [Planctomycetota bacterium]
MRRFNIFALRTTPEMRHLPHKYDVAWRWILGAILLFGNHVAKRPDSLSETVKLVTTPERPGIDFIASAKMTGKTVFSFLNWNR